MPKLIIIFILLSFSNISVAQSSNDDPCGAITVPVYETSESCTPQPYSASGTYNPAFGSGCYPGNNIDVWYKFSTLRPTVQVKLSAGVSATIYTASSCNGPFNQVGICFTPNSEYSVFLTPGTEYYLRIENLFPGGPFLSFSMCLTTNYTPESMRIGIHTNTPQKNLDVRGTARFNDTLEIKGPLVVSTLESFFSGDVGIGRAFPENKLSVTGDADFNGNVGIGMSTPGFPLNFPNATGDKISLYGNSGAHYGFGIQSGLLQIHTDLSESDIAFGYGSSASFTERMRIKGNGNVGIGTTSPNAPLQFSNVVANRKIVLYDVNNNDHQFYGIGLQGGELRYQINNADASSHHRFYAGINSSSSSLLFDIDGLGNAWLKGGLLQNSDARLKTNIHRIGNTLQNLQLLNGYTYNWISKDRDPSLQTGLLAQEVQKVYPQLVKEDEKGILSVNYSGMIPVLLEAIKELNHKMETLENENKEIKMLIQQLLKNK